MLTSSRNNAIYASIIVTILVIDMLYIYMQPYRGLRTDVQQASVMVPAIEKGSGTRHAQGRKQRGKKKEKLSTQAIPRHRTEHAEKETNGSIHPMPPCTRHLKFELSLSYPDRQFKR